MVIFIKGKRRNKLTENPPRIWCHASSAMAVEKSLPVLGRVVALVSAMLAGRCLELLRKEGVVGT